MNDVRSMNIADYNAAIDYIKDYIRENKRQARRKR